MCPTMRGAQNLVWEGACGMRFIFPGCPELSEVIPELELGFGFVVKPQVRVSSSRCAPPVRGARDLLIRSNSLRYFMELMDMNSIPCEVTWVLNSIVRQSRVGVFFVCVSVVWLNHLLEVFCSLALQQNCLGDKNQTFGTQFLRNTVRL